MGDRDFFFKKSFYLKGSVKTEKRREKMREEKNIPTSLLAKWPQQSELDQA